MAKDKGGPTKDQVAIAKDLRNMMADMASFSARIERSYENQADAMAKIASSMRVEGMTDSLGEINNSLKEVISILKEMQLVGATTFDTVGQAASKAGRELDKAKTPLDQLREKMTQTGENALSLKEKLGAIGDYLKDKNPIAVGAALGAMSGLAQGFRNVIAVGKGLLNLGASIVKTMFRVGLSIISIPFKLFKGLVSMAASGGGGTELAQAYENVRKEFGALKGPVASTIVNLSTNLKGVGVQGINSYRVLGNFAERMETFTKLFVGGGAAVQSFTEEFAQNGEALVYYQKGLGLTDEQMGAVAANAKAMGVSMGSVLNDMTKQSYALGNAFGVSAKLISKDMGKALQDTKHFAQLTVKEIGQASVYARKLGLELDKITGTLDAFETFDQAAESVSKLNETFGTNLDAFELMNAQNPADILDKLRKGFSGAGVAGETLNRAQLKMASSLTGMDEGTVKLALSSKNAGKSLEQIKKESEKAEKKTLTQTQAMSKLADAIERLVKSGGEGPKGFFESFFRGFTDGLQQTKEFRELMMNIRQSLMAVYQAGRQVGRAFVEYFPGVKEFLTGLKEIFSPTKFRSLANGVRDVFIQWFKDLNDPNGKASFSSLMTKLKEKFFGFFDSQGAAGRKVINGFKTFSMAVRSIVAGMIKWVLESITSMIKGITNFIKNPKGVGNIAGAAGEAISPMAQAFRDAAPALWEAMKELFGLLFDKLSKWFKEEAWPKIKPVLISMFVGPMIAKALLGVGTAALGAVVSGMITKAFANQGQKALVSEMGKLTKAMQAANAAKVGGPGPGPELNEAAKASEAAGGLQKAGAGINWALIGTILLALAGVIVVGLIGFLLAMLAIKATGATPADVATATLLIVGTATAALEVGLISVLLSKVNPAKVVKATAALLPIGIMIAALALIGGLLVLGIKAMKATEGDVMAAVTLVVGMAFAALLVGGVTVLLAAIGPAAIAGVVVAAAGLAAIALMIAAIAAIGYKLVKSVKDAGIKVEDVELAGKVLALSAQAIATASMAMGAAFSGAFFGMIAGPLSFFGKDIFGPLKKVISSVVDLADTLIKKIPDMPGDIKPKAEAISIILDSITKIISAFPPLMESLEGGILDSIFGRLPKKIDALSNLVEKLFGNENGGIIGVIKVVIDAVKAIGASEQALKAAEALGPIMEGIAGITKAMVMPDGMGEAIAAIEDTWTDDVTDLFGGLGGLSAKIAESINSVVNNLGDFLNNPNLKSIDKDTGAAIGSILQAIGPIAQALTPPPGAVEMVKVVAETWTETTTQLFKDLKGYIDNIKDVLVGKEGSKGILGGLQDLISGIVGSLRGLNFNEATAKVLSSIAPLISGVVTFITSLTGQALDMGKAKGSTDAIKETLSHLQTAAPSLFKSISDGIPPIISSITDVISKANINAAFLQKLEKVTKVFELVNKVTGMLKTMLELFGGTAEVIDPARVKNTVIILLNTVMTMANALRSMVDSSVYARYAGGTGNAPLIALSNALNAPAWKDILAVKRLPDIVKFFDSLSKIIDVFTRLPKFEAGKEKEMTKELAFNMGWFSYSIEGLILDDTYRKMGGNGAAPLRRLVNVLNNAYWKTAIGISPKVVSLLPLFENIGKISDGMVSATDKMKGLKGVADSVKDITAANLEPLVTAVADTISAAQAIGQSLEGVRGIDLSTKLQSFMTSFGPGMGAVEEYTVQSKDVVINVNFRIALEVDQIEKTIIEAGDSVIKDRINLLIDAMPNNLVKSTTGETNKSVARIGNGTSSPSFPGGGGSTLF